MKTDFSNIGAMLAFIAAMVAAWHGDFDKAAWAMALAAYCKADSVRTMVQEK